MARGRGAYCASIVILCHKSAHSVKQGSFPKASLEGCISLGAWLWCHLVAPSLQEIWRLLAVATHVVGYLLMVLHLSNDQSKSNKPKKLCAKVKRWSAHIWIKWVNTFRKKDNRIEDVPSKRASGASMHSFNQLNASLLSYLQIHMFVQPLHASQQDYLLWEVRKATTG